MLRVLTVGTQRVPTTYSAATGVTSVPIPPIVPRIVSPGLRNVLVVAPTSASDTGYFGELLATSLASRGVLGLVIDAGVRDAAALEDMKFPVWSSSISAQGTVKETLGDVNRPICCAGAFIRAGDLIVADDDGVVVVPRADAAAVLELSLAREAKEDSVRKRLEAGELGLDIYGMRPRLAEKGLVYLDGPED